MSDILVDDAFDVDPFVLADLPFNAYYPLTVGAPPVPKPKRAPEGGIGLPKRLPFWEAGHLRCRALVAGVAGVPRAEATIVEDELLSDENRLLGLL